MRLSSLEASKEALGNFIRELPGTARTYLKMLDEGEMVELAVAIGEFARNVSVRLTEEQTEEVLRRLDQVPTTPLGGGWEVLQTGGELETVVLGLPFSDADGSTWGAG